MANGMRNDTVFALEILREEALTCVICRGADCYKSTARGVAPLLQLLDGGSDRRGFCAADTVVGAGAAYLYVLLGVCEVYACVLSEGAHEILTRFGISCHFDSLVPQIRNRAGDGFCPIEAAVAGAADPQDALARIRKRLAELRK